MIDCSSDTVVEVVAQALESAFVTLEPAPQDIPPPASPVLLTMELGSPACATMEIATSRDFGAYLAANVLACAPTDEPALAQADDALKEILNIAAGLYLTRICEAQGAAVEMGLPEIRPLGDRDSWRRLTAQANAGDGALVLADGFVLFMRILARETA